MHAEYHKYLPNTNRFLVAKYRRQLVVPSGGCSLVARLVWLGFCSFYVKDCGMGEKKEGKENEKCSTMPNVLIKGYKILRTVRVGQDFSLAEVEHKQSGIPDCLCGSHRLIHYDSYRRYIKHVSENGAIYHLKVRCKRYKCLDCGRVFRERLEGVRP